MWYMGPCLRRPGPEVNSPSMRSLRSLTQGIRLAINRPAMSERSTGSRESNGGGGGNRTRGPCFREMAAMRDFRGQTGTRQRVNRYLLPCPIPLESSGVLTSLGEIVASGGTGVPTPGRFSRIGVAWPQLT